MLLAFRPGTQTQPSPTGAPHQTYPVFEYPPVCHSTPNITLLRAYEIPHQTYPIFEYPLHHTKPKPHVSPSSSIRRRFLSLRSRSVSAVRGEKRSTLMRSALDGLKVWWTGVYIGGVDHDSRSLMDVGDKRGMHATNRPQWVVGKS